MRKHHFTQKGSSNWSSCFCVTPWKHWLALWPIPNQTCINQFQLYSACKQWPLLVLCTFVPKALKRAHRCLFATADSFVVLVYNVNALPTWSIMTTTGSFPSLRHTAIRCFMSNVFFTEVIPLLRSKSIFSWTTLIRKILIAWIWRCVHDFPFKFSLQPKWLP